MWLQKGLISQAMVDNKTTNSSDDVTNDRQTTNCSDDVTDDRQQNLGNPFGSLGGWRSTRFWGFIEDFKILILQYEAYVSLSPKQWVARLAEEEACRERLIAEIWAREGEVEVLRARMVAMEKEHEDVIKEFWAQSTARTDALTESIFQVHEKEREAAMAASLKEREAAMAYSKKEEADTAAFLKEREAAMAAAFKLKEETMTASLKEREAAMAAFLEEKAAFLEEKAASLEGKAALTASFEEMEMRMSSMEKERKTFVGEMAGLVSSLEESEEEVEKLEKVLETLIKDLKEEREYIKVLETDLVELKAEMLANEMQHRSTLLRRQEKLQEKVEDLVHQLEISTKSFAGEVLKTRSYLHEVEKLGKGEDFKTKCMELEQALAGVQATVVKCERVLDEVVEILGPARTSV